MGFRFQKRIKIAPGLRINLSRSGASLTGGVRGASVSVGKDGAFANVGLPGTGLSHRSRIGADGGGSASTPTRGKGGSLLLRRLLVLAGFGLLLLIFV